MVVQADRTAAFLPGARSVLSLDLLQQEVGSSRAVHELDPIRSKIQGFAKEDAHIPERVYCRPNHVGLIRVGIGDCCHGNW